MSMKKAFDQTLRDLKRGVNKKVLKVPSVEQKVLDATSNESWGPHGSLLADIAQATRNSYEYQMIMSILWKRLNDTGKNWRHVYKALTVLEYLVANGSERVIDEIKEHAYQISTLSDFQYIDSSGRDQGNNVRRKSQSLVLLVNDKERIQEAREKAATNRDKFRSTSTGGGMYRPGSYSGSGDDRFESQYDERYGRYGDPYSREGDCYGRGSDDYYGRDRYGDDDSRGRARSVDGYRHGSRSRSSGVDGDRGDDDRHSARGSSARGENHPDGRPIERKLSEQNLGAPPSYEEAVDNSRSPTYSDRGGETPPASALQSSSPTINAAPHSSSAVADAAPSSSLNSVNPTQVTAEHGIPLHSNVEADGFDEFDPRASFPAAPVPTASNAAEMDLLGSLSDAFSPSPLAIMPASNTSDAQPEPGKTDSHPSFTAASGNNVLNQAFEDPFGDSPFKAIPSEETPSQPSNFASVPSFYPAVNPSEHSQPAAQKVEAPNLEFADTFSGLNFHPTAPDIPIPSSQQCLTQDDDILAGILPPAAPLHRATSIGAFPASSGVPSVSASYTAFPPTSHAPAGHGFMTQVGSTATPFSQTPSHSYSYSAPATPFNQQLTPEGPGGASSHQNNDLMGDMLPSSQLPSSNSTGSLSLVTLEQPAKEKFEPKSAVWADTLSKGLVNLNISGSKINPLSDIGIDFESLNRKEKRMEKPSTTQATSNVSMGKAMGSGSGMGRPGVSGMRPPPNPMMGSGMGIGMGGSGMGMGVSSMGMGGSGGSMGMAGYGSMNQQPMGMGMGMGGMGMGMGMGMNNMNMGMGMNNMSMGMAQGVMMQPTNGSTPGQSMNYNPMMGRGSYPQQPYGGAYRSM